MRKFLALLGAVGMMSLSLPIHAQQSVSNGAPSSQGQLQLDPAYNDAATTVKTYVIQLADDPAISYSGGHLNYAATAPVAGQRYDGYASHVQQYIAHLRDKQDAKLASIGASGQKLYSYAHAMNGFAARLTPEQAAMLRGDKTVKAVWEDYAMTLDTNNSPDFLGLNNKRDGLHRRLRLKGEDVIVGILDSGIAQGHPSFSDTRTFPLPRFCDNPRSRVLKKICRHLERYQTRVVFGDPPHHWNGACEVGEAWSEADCNNKLIGARWFAEGFIAGEGGVLETDFLSPRDADGHGSHTASTAAGNKVVASLNGVELDKIMGMAPRARLAAYKVCWYSAADGDNSCYFSDSAAATDAAVADGVDVINFSVGTASSFVDPQDLAFLDASSAGVFIARSAGNSGPGFGSTAAGEPWVTSVAASTLDGTGFALAATINDPASVAGDYTALEGAITQSLVDSGEVTDEVIAADPIDACVPLANDIGGHIALIARGACAFTTKVENAVNAGASAVLMYTDTRPKTIMGGTATPITLSVPGVMIDNEPGVAIFDALTGGESVNGTLSPTNFTTEDLEGNIMAGFSSRGPYLVESDWLKPDITAPGVRILAAYSEDQASGAAGGRFSYLQGTSMSSPHIAGLGALVIQAQPGFSPAQVKSALMTTARQDVVKEDGSTAGDPFDFGAGHVDPNGAVDPGLTYDAGLLDYLAASCGTVTPLISPSDCEFVRDTLGYSLEPADLNLPSISIGQLPGSQTVTRTVTAVRGYKGRHGFYGSNRPRNYYPVVEAPPGYSVEVSPDKLRLRPGESASYEVTITNDGAAPGEWFFGSLTWTDYHKHDVRIPIAVNGVAVIAPDEISADTTEGSVDFDVTFGYTGDYLPGAHGLSDADLFLWEVPDDPGNSFSFFGPGTVAVFLEDLPENTVHARWATFDDYTDGNDDIDMYLYYCPNFLCTQIDSSTTFTAEEEVSVSLPANDPSIPDPYLVFLHGWQTDGDSAQVIEFRYSVVDDEGNMTVTGPGSATAGDTGTVNATWSGLNSGTGWKYLGAISHNDGAGIKGLTLMNIQTDPGGSICDFGLCPP